MGNKISSSKYETRSTFEKWNNLPPEIKSECIKHLDFKTKFLLRSTSRTERALVDAQQSYLHYVQIEGLLPYPMNSIISSGYDDHKLTIFPSMGLEEERYVIPTRNRARFFETIVPLIVFILKTFTINKFSIEGICRSNWSNVLEEVLQTNLLSIRNFHGVMLRNQETLFFINKLNSITESVHLDANTCKNFPINALIENQTIINSTLLRIRDLHCKDAIWKLTEKWIESDANIGTTFRVTSINSKAMHQFAVKFKNRIISETDEEIRIKTDNPSKHILLKLARKWIVTRPLTCVVISANAKESEFEIFGQWATEGMIPLWEYVGLVISDDFNQEDHRNFINLLLQSFWIIFSLQFKRTVFSIDFIVICFLLLLLLIFCCFW